MSDTGPPEKPQDDPGSGEQIPKSGWLIPPGALPSRLKVDLTVALGAAELKPDLLQSLARVAQELQDARRTVIIKPQCPKLKECTKYNDGGTGCPSLEKCGDYQSGVFV